MAGPLTLLVLAFVLFFVSVMNAHSELSGPILLAALVAFLIGFGWLIAEAHEYERTVEQACARVNGYVVRGDNIELCIEYGSGRIVQPEAVER